MKKIIALASALTLCFTAAGYIPVSAAENTGTAPQEVTDTAVTAEGDANGDGIFNMSDIVTLQKWLNGDYGVNITNKQAVDLCKDGRIDVFDMVMMRKKLVESIEPELTGIYTIEVKNSETGLPVTDGVVMLCTNIVIETEMGQMVTSPIFTYDLAEGNPIKHDYSDWVDSVRAGAKYYVDLVMENVDGKQKYIIDRDKTMAGSEYLCIYVSEVPEKAEDTFKRQVKVIDDATGKPVTDALVNLGMNIEVKLPTGNWAHTTEIFRFDMSAPEDAVIDYTKYGSSIKNGTCNISIHATAAESSTGVKYEIVNTEDNGSDTFYVYVKGAPKPELTGIYTIEVINSETGLHVTDGELMLCTNIVIQTSNGPMMTGPVFIYDLAEGNPVKHDYSEWVAGVLSGSTQYEVDPVIAKVDGKPKYVISEKKTATDGEYICIYVTEQK